MKKLFSILLAVCMLLSLLACGSGDQPDSNAAPTDPASVEVELSEPITISFWHGIGQENMQ